MTPEDIAKLKRQLKEAKRVLKDIQEIGESPHPHRRLYGVWTVQGIGGVAEIALRRMKEMARGKRKR